MAKPPPQPQVGWAQAPDGSWHPIIPAPPPPKKGTSGATKAILAVLAVFGILVVIGSLTAPKKATNATTSGTSPASSSDVSTTSAAPPPTEPTTTLPPLTPEEIEAQFNAEVARACAAGGHGTLDPRWTGKDQAGLDFLVSACIENAKAAKLDQEIKSAGPPNVDGIVKDPDATKGQVYLFFIDITQFDAATGKCAFRGEWDVTVHQYNFEYKGDNAIFFSGDATSVCPILDGIDDKDVIKVWAKSLGKFDYKTQIGGETTVPSFDILKAEVIQKG